MALGLPDALQANGEVLDILNWLSRALKAGLLIPSAAIDWCFEKALVLILEVVKLLLTHPSAESQVGAVSKIGWTALKTAINWKNFESVRLLLTTQSGRAQADRSTAAGNALFKFAEDIGNAAIIALLRQAQPDS